MITSLRQYHNGWLEALPKPVEAVVVYRKIYNMYMYALKARLNIQDL